MGVNNTVGNKLWEAEKVKETLQENIAPASSQLCDLDEIEDLSAQQPPEIVPMEIPTTAPHDKKMKKVKLIKGIKYEN